jgi:hypothetical protein
MGNPGRKNSGGRLPGENPGDACRDRRGDQGSLVGVMVTKCFTRIHTATSLAAAVVHPFRLEEHHGGSWTRRSRVGLVVCTASQRITRSLRGLRGTSCLFPVRTPCRCRRSFRSASIPALISHTHWGGASLASSTCGPLHRIVYAGPEFQSRGRETESPSKEGFSAGRRYAGGNRSHALSTRYGPRSIVIPPAIGVVKPYWFSRLGILTARS